MTLQTINIDDRNYSQLLDFLKKQLPVEAWDDHNPSDPGIMLLELLTWLGEMNLYRMNRVDDRHLEKFLKLIIDPPEPVTVLIELAVTFDVNRIDSLIIPPGIRFATQFKEGERYIYETFERTMVSPPKPPDTTQSVIVTTRSWKQISDEVLGISDGLPNQAFRLKEGPVLLDFTYATLPSTPHPYRPNPVVSIDGTPWELKAFLLTEESKVETGSHKNHFMVDDFNNTIRFGDGTYGEIPSKGAAIRCDRYQIIQGPQALIKSGEISFMLDQVPDLLPGDSVQIAEQGGIPKSMDAEGGWLVLSPDTDFSVRLSTGLTNFRERYRLVTANDFEQVLLEDFNLLQQRTRDNTFNEIDTASPLPDNFKTLRRIERVQALMNVEPISSQFIEKAGHVTLLIIPEFDSTVMQNENITVPVKQELINIDEAFEQKIQRFLDTRRLITTRTHVIPARLRPVTIRMTVVVEQNRNIVEMDQTIRNELTDFFDILNGHFEKKGWPIGENIRKSKLYRLIEGVEGVNYVMSMQLDVPDDANVVVLADDQLPLLQSVSIALSRN